MPRIMIKGGVWRNTEVLNTLILQEIYNKHEKYIFILG